MFWAENLTKEGMIEFVNPRPGDAYEGESYWEEGDCDLHIPSGGGEVREEVTIESEQGICILAERDKLEIFRLAQDLPSMSSLIEPS